MPSEGTVVLDIVPPIPWPPEGDVFLYPRMVTPDDAISIYAQADGRLRVKLAPAGQAQMILTTCHITLAGEGLLRVAVAWNPDGVVVFAGGACIASRGDYQGAVPVAQHHIVLKETLSDLSKEAERKGGFSFAPGSSGDSL